jgi:hypothetical protein
LGKTKGIKSQVHSDDDDGDDDADVGDTDEDLSVFALMSSMTDFMIYIGVLSSVKLNWSDTANTILIVATSVSFTQVHSTSPLSCLIEPYSPVVRQIMVLLILASIPIMLILMVTLVSRCCRIHIAGFSLHDWRLTAGGVAVFLFHPTVAKQMFALLPVVEIGNMFYMANDLSVAAGTGTRHTMLLLATVVLSVYVVGLPLILCWALCDPRSRLATSLTFKLKAFKPGQRYWAIVVLLRKTTLTMVVSILQDPWQQLYAAAWIMALSTIAHTTHTPYAHPSYQAIETFSLSTSTFIISLSLAIPIVGGTSVFEVVVGIAEIVTLLCYVWLILKRASVVGLRLYSQIKDPNIQSYEDLVAFSEVAGEAVSKRRRT